MDILCPVILPATALNALTEIKMEENSVKEIDKDPLSS